MSKIKNVDLLKEALELGGMDNGRDFLIDEKMLWLVPISDRGPTYFRRGNFDFKKLRTTYINFGETVIKKDFGALTIEILHLFKLRDKGSPAEFYTDTIIEFDDDTNIELDSKVFLSYYTVKYGSFIKQTNGDTYFLRIRTKDLTILKTYIKCAVEHNIKTSDIKMQQQKELYYYVHVNIASFKNAGVPFDYFKILNKKRSV